MEGGAKEEESGTVASQLAKSSVILTSDCILLASGLTTLLILLCTVRILLM